MSLISRHDRRISAWTGLMAAAFLAGCATTPKPAPPPPPPASDAAKPAFTPLQMAPIPNPTDQAPRPSASGGQTPPAVKHPVVKPAPVKPPEAPVPNPIRASQLRAAGLIQLNRGAITRAVSLLRQANQADPDNKLIQRDLERALRISKADSAKP